jgi:hypothetical protein
MEISSYVITRGLVTALSFLVIALCFWLLKRRAKKAKEFAEVLRKRTE